MGGYQIVIQQLLPLQVRLSFLYPGSTCLLTRGKDLLYELKFNFDVEDKWMFGSMSMDKLHSR